MRKQSLDAHFLHFAALTKVATRAAVRIYVVRKLYEKWMVDWETRLTERDTNRVVRPFEWGVEWTRGWPFVNGNFPQQAGDHQRYLHELNDELVRNSDEFFAYQTPRD